MLSYIHDLPKIVDCPPISIETVASCRIWTDLSPVFMPLFQSLWVLKEERVQNAKNITLECENLED